MSSEGVKAVERAAQILVAFSGAEASFGITELAKAMGLPKSVVHRCVQSLAEYGLLSRDGNSRRYALGPTTIELGLRALGSTDVLAKAQPIMSELSLASAETTALTMRVGDERMYVAQVEGPQVVRMKVELGRRHPLYVGASGKAILASLPEDELNRYLAAVELARLTPTTICDTEELRRELDAIRSRGFAVSLGERDQWAASVAASVRGLGGRVVGSIAVCGPLARFTPETITDYSELILQAATELSAA